MKEIVKKLSERITNAETRKRSRTAEEYQRFLYAIEYILTDIWKSSYIHPEAECSIHKHNNYYSSNPRYRDPNLTYKMTMAAFDGLQLLNLIVVTKDGYYDRTKMQGGLTRYRAREELLEMLNAIPEYPAIHLKPNLDAETILLRQKIDNKNVLVPYDEDAFTDKARNNLRTINHCFTRHWADLCILDKDVLALQERLFEDTEKQPIDLTKRTLVRIFSNNSFEEGGRFYRGWWQNVPSEYRPHITIDGKPTVEHDYSQLNPNMIYSVYNKELGSEDAYSRVAGEEHRDVVKQAFNAMFQATTTLERKPDGIDLDAIGMSWRELKEEILKAHKPIKDLFFTGLGNNLQFEDSNIAESIMLHFAKMDAPTLPVHDSFIMHHGFSTYGELEEAMRRAFHDRFHRDIKVKGDIVVQVKPTKDYGIGHKKFFTDISVDGIVNADDDCSQWRDRDSMWKSRE
ncbi:hypothetical protein OAT44_07900 [Alphaproteobacteria bacterium]|nr:hypothetical protein [Alphaproteobacteria bacterium]